MAPPLRASKRRPRTRETTGLMWPPLMYLYAYLQQYTQAVHGVQSAARHGSVAFSLAC